MKFEQGKSFSSYKKQPTYNTWQDGIKIKEHWG